MKERRSFSLACAKIHELPISVFLLSFSVSPLSVSPVFPVSLSLALSPWSLASLPRLSSRVVCRRVVRSLASSRRLSSRVVCRLVVRRPAARCQSRRVRSRVGVSRVSSCVVPLLGVSRVVCGVLPPSSVSLRCAQSPRRQESRVIGSSVVLRRVCHVVVRRPAAGVSRVVRSACESRPFFLSFQTRWMTFFFVLY